MKKHLAFLGLFLLLIACIRQNNEEHIQNFVLAGYRGFYLIDTTKWQYDSTRFDIREYLKYEIDSSVKISKRWYNTSSKYFKISKTDSSKLLSLLKRLISMNLKDTDYYQQKDLEMYDGLYYSIDFSTNRNRHLKINYVPHHLPKDLQGIHDSVEKIIWSAKDSTSKNFSYDTILKQNAIKLYRRYPPPPPPDTIYPKVKFTKPIIPKHFKN